MNKLKIIKKSLKILKKNKQIFKCQSKKLQLPLTNVNLILIKFLFLFVSKFKSPFDYCASRILFFYDKFFMHVPPENVYFLFIYKICLFALTLLFIFFTNIFVIDLNLTSKLFTMALVCARKSIQSYIFLKLL